MDQVLAKATRPVLPRDQMDVQQSSACHVTTFSYLVTVCACTFPLFKDSLSDQELHFSILPMSLEKPTPSICLSNTPQPPSIDSILTNNEQPSHTNASMARYLITMAFGAVASYLTLNFLGSMMKAPQIDLRYVTFANDTLNDQSFGPALPTGAQYSESVLPVSLLSTSAISGTSNVATITETANSSHHVSAPAPTIPLAGNFAIHPYLTGLFGLMILVVLGLCVFIAVMTLSQQNIAIRSEQVQRGILENIEKQATNLEEARKIIDNLTAVQAEALARMTSTVQIAELIDGLEVRLQKLEKEGDIDEAEDNTDFAEYSPPSFARYGLSSYDPTNPVYSPTRPTYTPSYPPTSPVYLPTRAASAALYKLADRSDRHAWH